MPTSYGPTVSRKRVAGQDSVLEASPETGTSSSARGRVHDEQAEFAATNNSGGNPRSSGDEQRQDLVRQNQCC